MNVNRRIRRRALVTVAALGAPLLAIVPVGSTAATSPPAGSCDWVAADTVADLPVAEAARALGELETFGTAIDASGLAETLDGDGPFTVFAATNAAIDAVPESVFTALLNDPELLATIVGFHIVEGERLGSADLAAVDTVETLSGPLAVTSDGGTLVLDGQAAVPCVDIETANATLHVIDVLLQPATDDLGPGSSVPGSSVPASSVPGSSVPRP